VESFRSPGQTRPAAVGRFTDDRLLVLDMAQLEQLPDSIVAHRSPGTTAIVQQLPADRD
jgi:hypothetical protein